MRHRLLLRYLAQIALLFAMACFFGSACTRRIPFTPALPTSPTPTPQPTLPPPSTLRSLAGERGIFIGSAVDPDALSKDPAYAGLLEREFSSLTPENAMKFEELHPDPRRYDFSDGDSVVAFARDHGLVVRGHTLVWDNQLPAWVLEGNYTREEWAAILRDHIRTVVGHYRGQVTYWDVVNEALDNDGLLRDTIWLRAIGPEYIALAFQWAHEADPEARLFYNDNGGEGLNRKSQAVFALVQGLLQAGTPVHGVGLQMHVWPNGSPSAEDLAANMSRLGALGLEVHITEMDVRLQYSNGSDAEKLAAQAKTYREVFAACLAAENCKAFVTWGLTDRHSWIPWFTGHPDAPLLFDEAGRPKPAYHALMDVLRGK